MGKTVRLGFGVILMSYLASCAGMEVSPVSKPMAPAPLPQYTVGDAFVFDSGIVNDTQTVVAVDERTVTLESNVFGTLTQHRDFGLPESWTGGLTQAYTTTAVTTPSGLFPLKVGNRSNVTGVYIYSQKGTYTRNCIVEEQVRVTVPAGSFDSFKIQCAMDYVFPTGTSIDKDYIWYAPAVNHWVAINRHGRLLLLNSFTKISLSKH